MNPSTEQAIRDASILSIFAEYDNKSQGMEFSAKRAELLGRTVVAFQFLEFTARSFVRFLAGLDQQTADILTCKLSFKSLSTVLGALAKQRGLSSFDKLRMLLKGMGKCEEIRNQLVHSLWTSGPRLKWDASVDDGWQTKFEEYTDPELEEIETFINRLSYAITQLMVAYALEKVPKT
jgi:hypothetical protein